MTAVPLGSWQVAVLEHLREHPGLTAGELERSFAIKHSLLPTLHRLEEQARVVAVTAHEPAQGRRISRWHVTPDGAVPPPRPAPDPEAVRRRRERDAAGQRARRARRNPPRRPGPRTVPPVLADAACRGVNPDLFFGPDYYEEPRTRHRRERQAKDICAGCLVRLACLTYALDSGQEFGIWGGTIEDERRAILRHQRSAS